MEEIVLELKRAADAVEGLVKRMEEQREVLVEKVEAQYGKLAEKIEKITAVAEGDNSHPSASPQDGAPSVSSGVGGSRKTMNSFVAKIMAEAEGADPKQIDSMLSGLTVEQRVAVKMQMMKAGIL